MTFADRLAELRKARGLPQWKCAERAGISQPGWAHMELRACPASIDTLRRIAKVLELDDAQLAWLVRGPRMATVRRGGKRRAA